MYRYSLIHMIERPKITFITYTACSPPYVLLLYILIGTLVLIYPDIYHYYSKGKETDIYHLDSLVMGDLLSLKDIWMFSFIATCKRDWCIKLECIIDNHLLFDIVLINVIDKAQTFNYIIINFASTINENTSPTYYISW